MLSVYKCKKRIKYGYRLPGAIHGWTVLTSHDHYSTELGELETCIEGFFWKKWYLAGDWESNPVLLRVIMRTPTEANMSCITLKVLSDKSRETDARGSCYLCKVTVYLFDDCRHLLHNIQTPPELFECYGGSVPTFLPDLTSQIKCNRLKMALITTCSRNPGSNQATDGNTFVILLAESTQIYSSTRAESIFRNWVYKSIQYIHYGSKVWTFLCFWSFSTL